MNPDNPITPTASYPTAAEVEWLRQVWLNASVDYASTYDTYNTARAAHEAANDTGRILDEAIAARQVALDAYSVTWATHDRAVNAAAEAIDARVAANVANCATRTAYNDALAAVDAARKAHAEATR
jgi:IMP cyclohydrolase